MTTVAVEIPLVEAADASWISGWADAGWHRNYTGPGGAHIPPTVEVQTPNLNALVHDGIELDRNYGE